MPRTLTTLWRKAMLSTQRTSQRKSVRARMQRIQMLPPPTKVVMREAHPKRSPLKVERAELAPCQMTTHWLWELELPLWSPTLTRARSKGQSKTVRKASPIQIMSKAVWPLKTNKRIKSHPPIIKIFWSNHRLSSV